MNRDIHLPGGNLFDNMKIDIVAAYSQQDILLNSLEKKEVKQGVLHSYTKLIFTYALIKLNIYEFLVANGLINNWFLEFRRYWQEILGGRPITIFDMPSLRFHYRRKIQSMESLEWDGPDLHIKNWQEPQAISYTLQLLYRQAIYPIRYKGLWKYLKNEMNVLEYGCALAPMYSTWRQFLSHKPIYWTLADIENFPFHYTRFLYSQDKCATLIKISAENLNDPLCGLDRKYDLIIIQEVFEHLHEPLHIAQYLLSRLNLGGLFIFDYIVSEATGLDTPAGLTQRDETLAFLEKNLTIIEGHFLRDGKSIGLCVGKLK